MFIDKIKFIGSISVISVLLAFPTLSNASDLWVNNNTAKDFSFKINSVCSPEFGVIPPHSIYKVTESDFNKALKNTDGVSYVYASNNCSGDAIAQIDFDTISGIGLITVSTQYKVDINGQGFHLKFSDSKSIG